jgi:hypothetical protein
LFEGRWIPDAGEIISAGLLEDAVGFELKEEA